MGVPRLPGVSDITEIPTDEGALYLAVTLDLWSRMVVGWAIRETMEEELVQHAFDMAVQQCRPDAGLLHHSESGPRRGHQGSQYTANGFRGQLRHRQIVESNSRKGNVWDTPDGRGLTPLWSRSFHLSKWSCFGSNTSRPKPKPFRRCSSTSKSSTIVNVSIQHSVGAALLNSRRRAETNLSVH